MSFKEKVSSFCLRALTSVHSKTAKCKEKACSNSKMVTYMMASIEITKSTDMENTPKMVKLIKESGRMESETAKAT